VKLTKKHIATLAAVSIILGALALIFYLWQKYRSKSASDILAKTSNMTSIQNENDPSSPAIYGAQKVVQNASGIWTLAPGTCELVTNGIVDWDAIEGLSQSQKDQLYNDLGECKTDNLPLIQPT